MGEHHRRRGRHDLPRVGGARPAAWLLTLAWLAVGLVVVGQARLPELSRPARASRPVACWAVNVASGPASATSLRRGLVRLRRAGLQATLRPGRSPQTRVLVVTVASRSGVRAARAKAARLGYRGGTVLRLPATVCRR
jgi:hypothetical protein